LGVTNLGGCTSVDTTDYAQIWARKTNSYGFPQVVDDDAAPNIDGLRTVAVETTYGGIAPSAGTKMIRLSGLAYQSAQGWDVIHGPAVVSGTFSAQSGEVITFDWQARYESDDFAVLGYLLNTSTCTQTEIVDATGTNSSDMSPAGTGSGWQRASVTIPTTSATYRFVFVSGTFDRSGGQALGATMLIDNIAVGQPQVVTFAQPADQAIGAFSHTATSSAGLPVKYSSATPAKCTVSSDGLTVTLVAAGTCTLTASADGGVASSVTYAPSNQVTRSFTVLSVTTPGAPTVTGVTTSGTTATVRFTPPASDGGSPITNYKVRSWISVGTPGSWVLSGVTTSPLSLSGLQPGYLYDVQIMAVNAQGDGPVSNTVRFSVAGEPAVPVVAPVVTSAAPSTAAPSTAAPTTAAPVPTSAPVDTSRSTIPDGSTPAVPVTATPGSLPTLAVGGSLSTENGQPVPVVVNQVAPGGWQMTGPGFQWQMQIPAGDTPGSSQGVVTLVRDREVEVSGTGFLPGSLVDVWLFSKPTFLGTVKVGANGSFEGSLKVPASMPIGGHTLQANGLTPDNEVRSLNLGVQVAGLPRLPVTGSDDAGAVRYALVATLLGAATLAMARRRRARV